jgi:methylmalonyl-CoA mutase C-terminal domain/subunit
MMNTPHQERRIRVLIAKPGLDGHDRGAKVVSRGLRDAGMEVIYTGLRRTPAQIVDAAMQEDVDVIGLSVLSGAHDRLFRDLLARLGEADMKDVLVVGGGIIPEADAAELKAAGVTAIFPPGTSIEEIVTFIRENVKSRA